jgi:opacity protein-like surface antigen
MPNFRTLLVPALVVSALGLVPHAARAQGYFSGFAGYTYGGAAGECPSVWNDCPNRQTGYGFAFGGMSGVFGFDQEYAWTPDVFGEGGDLEGSKVTTLMSNILVGVPVKSLRIYGAVGIGLVKTKVEFRNAEDYSDTAFGWDYGAGVIVFFPAHLGIRFDYRRFRSSAEVPFIHTDRRDVQLEFSRVSIGLVLH